LWEQVPAAGAADDLRDTLAQVLRRQHAAATSRFATCRNPLRGLLRWLLTIGAILWFPIVQPVLELALNDSLAHTARGVLLLAVQLLGATYLLRSAGFLAIWFVFLWLILRWDTQRRVARMLTRWQRVGDDAEEGTDQSLNPAAAALAWVDELLDPLRAAREREDALVERADILRKQLDKPAA